MKNSLAQLQSYFRNIASMLGAASSWQRVLGTHGKAMGYLNRVPIVLFGKAGRSWMLSNIAFYRVAKRVYRTQGSKGLALFLKVSHVCIIKYSAGQPIKNGFGSLGHHVRLASGIPCWLPKAVRKELRRRDTNTVRYWLTLTSLYRVLDFKGKPKLSTIRQPGTEFNVIPYLDFVGIFFSWLVARVGSIPELKEVKLFHIPKSGPGTHAKPVFLGKKAIEANRKELRDVPLKKRASVNLRSPFAYKLGSNTSALVFQAMAWFDPLNKDLRQVFNQYCRITKSPLYGKMQSIADQAGLISFWRPLVPAYLGKLGVKEEPGKVRVFAMVDWWTQMAMRPLHDLVFSILRKIRQDGTHNQGAAVDYIREQLARLPQGEMAHSFDLSAATDRLPVLLQSFLVNHLLPGTGQLWALLLTHREYEVPKSIRRLGMKIPKVVRYAVGQPMGALSSWALLALTHHFIVQLAAYRVGFYKWFHRYAVLGDDIVILDNAVAKEYLIIMEDLGVSVNLTKSVQSKDGFEFAKRNYVQGRNVSPLSFKELDVAGASLDALLQLVQRFQGEGMRLSSIMRLRGYGYRSLGKMSQRFNTMSRRLRFLMVWLTFPGHTRWSFDTVLDWIRGSSLGRASHSINTESLRGIIADLAKAWDPNRFYKGRFLSSQSTDVLGPTGLWNEEYPGLPPVEAWRVSMVDTMVSGMLWPVETDYFDTIRKSDAIWNAIDMSRLGGDLSSLAALLEEMLDHRVLDSLLPSSIDVSVYRSEKVILRAGRWLTYWVRLRKCLSR